MASPKVRRLRKLRRLQEQGLVEVEAAIAAEEVVDLGAYEPYKVPDAVQLFISALIH